MKYKIFNSKDSNVKKFVFEKTDIAVESVLYKYGSYKTRTVICCSVQCGCPVGCSFCGTGKFFVRNLTCDEIVAQVTACLGEIDCQPHEIMRFQIMFMSMGEPFLNSFEVFHAIKALSILYPTADLLISTVGPNKISQHTWQSFMCLSAKYDKVGLQFSIHESNDQDRAKLISPQNTLKLQQIAELGYEWATHIRRKPFINYCVHENNNKEKNANELIKLFSPDAFEYTLSVICEKDDTMQNAISKKVQLVRDFADRLTVKGCSVRIFNPAGQDDIGGGCGQLWYFQEWLKKQRKEVK